VPDKAHDAIDDKCAKAATAAFLANPEAWTPPACVGRPRETIFD
jgi:hypothetical protein